MSPALPTQPMLPSASCQPSTPKQSSLNCKEKTKVMMWHVPPASQASCSL